MSVYEIHPLQTAKTVRPLSSYTYLKNFGMDVNVFYGAFLLKGVDRNVLVDTGCDASSYTAGPLSPVEDVASLDQNLDRFGLSVQEIDAVIITHLHFDHTAFLGRFRHCPIFVQETELSAAHNPHPYFSAFYVPAFFKDVPFERTAGDESVFPGIEVVRVPGHSAGSQAVIVETDEGRAAVSGFCCVAENFEKENLAIPGIHEDVRQAYDSLYKLVNLVDIVYPTHSAFPVKLRD